MIFLVSEKTFVKNAKKILKARDYVIIDGSDSGSIDDDAMHTDISTTFNNVVVNGGFTPHHRLVDALKKDMKGRAKQETEAATTGNWRFSWATENMLSDFLKSDEFVGAALAAVKGFTLQTNSSASGNSSVQRNIFIVLPNRVYKLMRDIYAEHFHKLLGVDFQFVYTEEELMAKMKLLIKDLKRKKIDYLRERVVKVAKKHKLT